MTNAPDTVLAARRLYLQAFDGDADLDEVIGLLRAAVESESDAWRPIVMDVLADALLLRFERAMNDAADDDDVGRALDDLDAAIATTRDALAIAAEDRRMLAASCGEKLNTRYRVFKPEWRDEDDLHEAIDLLNSAVDGAEPPDLFAAASLAEALADRYELHGADTDRDEAIHWFQVALDALFLSKDRDALVDVQRFAELLLDRAGTDDLTAAIGYAERCLTALPDDAAVLHLLGQAHVQRAGLHPTDPRAELAVAAAYLRRALALPPVPDPSPNELAAVLGLVLSTWVSADNAWGGSDPGEARERADEAISLLTGVWEGSDPEHWLHTWARFQTAMTLAFRFLGLGDAADREAALAELQALVDSPDFAPDLANICRLNIARVLVMAPAPFEAPPSPEDAERALTHLKRISIEDGGVTLEDLLDMRAYATLCLRPDGPTEEDIERAIRDTEAAYRASEEDDPERAVRLGVLAETIALRAGASGRPDDERQAVETLAGAVEDLDPDHGLRPMMLGTLGASLGGAWTWETGSAERRDAVVALLERVLRQMPDGHPSRVQTLTRLGGVLIGQTSFDHSPERLDRVRGLLCEAIDHPATDRENEAVNHFLLAEVDQIEAVFRGDARRLDGVAERLKHAADLVPEEHPLRVTILNALSSLYDQRHTAEGGLEFLDAADHYAELVVEAARRSGDTSGYEALRSERHLAISPLFRNPRRVTLAMLDQVIERLEALSARTDVDEDLAFARFFRARVGPGGLLSAGRTGGDPREMAATAEMLTSFLKEGDTDITGYPFQLAMTGNIKIGHGHATQDLRTLDEGLSAVGDAYELIKALPPGRRWESEFVSVLALLGAGLALRYELSGDRADLSNGIDRLEAARGAMSGVSLAFGPAEALASLAGAYYQRNDPSLEDRRRAVRLGIEMLGEYGAAVLLQDSPERAFEMAATIAAGAVEVARWGLGEGLTGAAVEALERGRAMVLHAATTDSRVPEMLRRAGAADLADEWEEAPHAAADPAPWREPSDLRHRALAAIEGTEAEQSLLAPPSIEEITGALAAVEAEALVYLLASDKLGPGTAVVVDAGGRICEVPLPGLEAGPHSLVDAFAAAQSDLVQSDPAEEKRIRRRWTDALGDLCDWAWGAAMEDVLASMSGRPARVVLVPVGGLGQVPWHAARRAVGEGRWRYACHDAVISYAASARQFVDACDRGRLPCGDGPALVRVGGSALYWASKEIEEIHRRHYPHGVLLGGRKRHGPQTLPATKDNVRDLLPRQGSGGASLLHLGCHAHPAPRPVDSSLALLRGEKLNMSEVLERARARPPGSPGGLVVLAACGSDLTATDHDEALTLAAAFLAAGASGAVGARWPVDDVPTALLMAMFHHYLNSGYDDPARALRAAQLWMLNPSRRLPADADPKLADELAATDLAAPAAWAAFTHQGA